MRCALLAGPRRVQRGDSQWPQVLHDRRLLPQGCDDGSEVGDLGCLRVHPVHAPRGQHGVGLFQELNVHQQRPGVLVLAPPFDGPQVKVQARPGKASLDSNAATQAAKPATSFSTRSARRCAAGRRGRAPACGTLTAEPDWPPATKLTSLPPLPCWRTISPSAASCRHR
jgi:hypothetical protein